MLKVVGASWQKTRIGTYILIGAGLLVIAAFFVAEMDRPEYDGTYCATALWTEKVGFQIEYWKQQNDLVNIPKGAARICYKDSIYQNGWAQLEIETQRSYPDWVQAYGAGILEGSLTWNNIYNQWLNTIGSACDKDENAQNFCTWLRDTLSANYLATKKRALARADHDQYWHQIALYFYQLEGLETGYIRGATRARSDLEEEIPFVDFLLMNSAADIQDLKIYYENYVLKESSGSQSEKNFFLPSATMFTKIFQTEASSGWQLLFGHSSAGSYSSMLRIQKRYKFRYHFSPDQRSNSVPGVDISFTGYPGILGSTDDFYIVKGRQVQSIVAGVTMRNENLELWKNIDVADAIPLTARVMAANRIAQSRRSWAKAMSRHPFTGNKQWVSVDLNKLNGLDGSQHSVDEESVPEVSANGLVWIVEQLPGRLHVEDVSNNFLSGNTTWVANGVPYFDEILEASRVPAENFSMDLPEGDDLTTLESVDKYLRLNGFRGDLLGDESVPYGNIDIKLFAFNSEIGVSDYHAFAGPIFMRFHHNQDDALTSESHVVVDLTTELEVITDRRPVRNDMRAIAMRQGSGPFKWSTVAERIPGVEHEGHPDVWDFDHVSPKWAW
ncbi:putative phospholipase B-like lamina ancestor [Episyrphus balteatus]|uniref:putative phospholipase B-like lamina ancestor n=1 Tax=Episyrphus balteatus TaxID=286459 RepID=UPI0024863659|nr:putative phospholipase B-like lamina ancestor [Episyrphus balteatus]XP_055841266.1 putative phospholipase B-like lamina ancestor [Episyrphus balteatus]XP_055841267.1 putative phospholipase B-like lamina ancestor [Episyrphus balteatus]XP_055841268.1 putative phospholipase B-like lamina ancestor [Episyrphus balteatus]